MSEIPWEMLSPAERLAKLKPEAQARFYDSLTDTQLFELNYDFFGFFARPKQIPPTKCDDPECGCGGLWNTLVVLCGRGWGKDLALDTPIPTPTGWTTMGALSVGDAVFDEAGRPCRVLRVFDQFQETPWRVRFSDGSTLDAGPEHQWVTWTNLERKTYLRSPRTDHGAFPSDWPRWRVERGPSRYDHPVGPQVRTTQDILESLRDPQGSHNHAIPVCAPLRTPATPLDVDPYVLGIWLGDGASAAGAITTADVEVVGYVQEAGYQTTKWADKYTYGVGGLQVQLRALGVLGDKHVPARYLRAAPEQRAALLRGLMDADGYAESSRVEFCNTNRRLIDGVYELAASLGQKPRIYSERARLDGRDVGPRWRVVWRPTIQTFRLTRKAARIYPSRSQRLRNHHRMILGADPLPPQDTRCIQVDSPNAMFLAGRAMIPTHNTRFICEYAHYCAGRYPGIKMALASPTAGDVRKVVAEGVSGLLATQKPWNEFDFRPATNQGFWANGSHVMLMSADEPDRARGPGNHLVLCDEVAAWPRTPVDDDLLPGLAMLENLKLTLREPRRPGWPDDFRCKMILATTPRPTGTIKRLVGVGGYQRDKKTHTIYGHTNENQANLSEIFLDETVGNLEGTRLGQQELAGKILLDSPGALWKTEYFRYVDQDQVPDLRKVVVAVDPNVGGLDLCGIVVVGIGPEPGKTLDDIKESYSSRSAAERRQRRINGYVLADLSEAASPDTWGRKVVRAYHDYNADLIVAESNNGGELVSSTLQTIDATAPVKLVHASRGKQTRAEPIAALYEQGRVWHVGAFPQLEDELTTWDPVNSRKSPDRLDALVWGLHRLMGRGRVNHNVAPQLVPLTMSPIAGGIDAS